MKKFKFISSFLLVLSSIISFSLLPLRTEREILADENKNLFFSTLSADEKNSQYQRIIDLLLFDAVHESINKVYGEDQRQYWKFEILEIERGYYPSPFDYRLTVKFQTFTGAHSEPYDENIAVYDIISFSPLKIKEVSYEHYPSEL